MQGFAIMQRQQDKLCLSLTNYNKEIPGEIRPSYQQQ